jgi:hypothetical protein
MIFVSRILDNGTGWLPVVVAAFLSGLTILSHPTASLFLVFSIILLFIYKWSGQWIKVVVIGLGAMLVSSPWWISTLSVHGMSPFLGATNTGHVDWFQAKYLLTLNFEYENRFFLPIVSLLALVGLFNKARRKALFLGLLVGLGYIFIPRGGIDFLTIYVALLGTLGFDLIADAISDQAVQGTTNERQIWIFSRKPRIALLFLVIYTFIGAYTYKYVDEKGDLHLTQETFQAMIWLKEQTPLEATIIALPPDESHRNWPNDYWGEWLPTISERVSLSTVQGYEWLPALFSEKIYHYISLRKCTSSGLICIESWQDQIQINADYLFIGDKEKASLLIEELETANIELVYSNDKAVVFKLPPK